MLLLTTCNFFLSCCYAISDDFVVEDRGSYKQAANHRVVLTNLIFKWKLSCCRMLSWVPGFLCKMCRDESHLLLSLLLLSPIPCLLTSILVIIIPRPLPLTQQFSHICPPPSTKILNETLQGRIQGLLRGVQYKSNRARSARENF